jgi:tRNA pseudouridine38-40 synthase
MVLAYDGGPFAGWQVQPGKRTVQGEVEAVLARLCDHPVRVHGSGRTDAGVHAWGQVASFATASCLAPQRMLKALAALLPPEIYPRALSEVPQEFHARYSVRAKTYDYFLWPATGPALFLRGRLWPLARELDARLVRQALAVLPGERDLAAFASRNAEAGSDGSTVRRILEARLDEGPRGLWRIRLTATGFLRHVVRNLVGSLAQVGWGGLAPSAIPEMLKAGRRLHPGPKSPACGLYLNRVYYGTWPGVPKLT